MIGDTKSDRKKFLAPCAAVIGVGVTMHEMPSFGAWLKRRRKALDLTQEALARLAGCAVVSIRKIEADEQRPSRQTAERLAQHLQIAPDEQATFVQFARLGLEEIAPALPIPASAQLPSRPPQNHLDFVVAHPASDAPTARPSGTVTFLFTDIEGSTGLWERHADLMPAAFQRQEAILRQVIATHGGHAYKMIGDAFQAAFATAAPALNAAVAAQCALAAEVWGAIGPVRVRMALDSGMVEERGDDYVGPLLNRTARLLATGHGGQILLSAAARELVRSQLPPDVTLRDLGTHRLKDLTHPEQIFQVLAPGLPAEFPPLRTATAPTTTLPHPATPFVGRAAELAELAALLDDPTCRLLTLTGPGGIGKTRLALATAAERADRHPHGVWFVNLAPLNAADCVVSAIADTFKLSGLGVADPEEALRNYLREKALLLVLDNFEHVLDAADVVADMLASAPGVTILHIRQLRRGPAAAPRKPRHPASDWFKKYHHGVPRDSGRDRLRARPIRRSGSALSAGTRDRPRFGQSRAAVMELRPSWVGHSGARPARRSRHASL
jgi:class 3 adenylate cyclase/DNA-binding XRE family transcriptional regulator